MEFFDVDTDLLITLVENRPVLWDKRLEGYKSRSENTAAWREVFMELNPGFEDLTVEEMNKYGKTIITKWTNIRDRQIKYMKKISEEKTTGSKGKSIKKYIYSDRLGFLKKNTVSKGTACIFRNEGAEAAENSAEVDGNSKNDNDPQTQTFRLPPSPAPLQKRRRQKSGMTDVESSIPKKLQEPDDRHLSFFKGIIPSLQKFDDTETIQFQVEVLKVIQNINQARTNPMNVSWPMHQQSSMQPAPNFSGSQGLEQHPWIFAPLSTTIYGRNSFLPVQPWIAAPMSAGHSSTVGQPHSQQSVTSPSPPTIPPPTAGSSHSPLSQNSTLSNQSTDSVRDDAQFLDFSLKKELNS